MPPTSYFVCTLGQAIQVPDHGILSLNHLLDVQASKRPNVPVVGFPIPSAEGAWGIKTLTYKELRNASVAIAHHYTNHRLLPSRTHEHGKAPIHIALLSPSSLDFVVTLFGAIRMGLSVLLIAPQCTPKAVTHLCASMNVNYLIHDPSLSQLAQDAISVSEGSLQLVSLPNTSTWFDNLSSESQEYPAILNQEDQSSMCCFTYHSSGTSSGLPKPLPQTHRIMTALHPRITGAPAAFSSTPLYHGGLADLIRSLNSEAMLYLFPSEVPITRTNILKSLDACQRFAASQPKSLQHHCDIRYFSCVPYVLKMLVDGSDETLDVLRSMEMVGTGGAPLPQELGDSLVAHGVRLVSRYGSAECGFLMSSARNFDIDKEWQYLRSGDCGGSLTFELQDGEDEEELYELVIKPSWPCLTKVNLPDGSFATGDIYLKHPSIPEAWKYLGRKDDMLVLVNGKKVDPVPYETALNSASKEIGINEAIVFGVNRAQIGVLVVPAPNQQPEDVRLRAWSIIENINATVPGHARISSLDMIVVIGPEIVLPKSSKGTLQRPLIYQQYQKIIDQVYETLETGLSDCPKKVFGSFDDIQEYTLQVIREVVSSSAKSKHDQERNLSQDTDLFGYGVDSLQSARIRNRLQAELELDGKELPSNIVYEQGDAKRLALLLFSIITGQDQTSLIEDEISLMRNMVLKYQLAGVDFPRIACKSGPPDPQPRVLVLTGVTGALGAHILNQVLLQEKRVFRTIYCLCRAEDDSAALQRVHGSFARRCLALPSPTDVRLFCLSSTFGDPRLGLADEIYDEIAEHVTDIIHAAWAVNFVGNLRSFEADHIRGVHHLLQLAMPRTPHGSPANFYFCSSGASILGGDIAEPRPEMLSDDPNAASAMGYARSKWVAEQICANAWKGPLRGHVSILRIGQLCGDSQMGVWNENEGWPLMLRTVDEVSALPDLQTDVYWLPVDVAAQAVVEVVSVNSEASLSAPADERCPVFHLMNPTPVPWSDLCEWMRRFGKHVESISPRAWIVAMSKSEEDLAKNPSRKLMGLWESSYGTNHLPRSEPIFATRRAEKLAPCLKAVRVDERLMMKTFKHWASSGFMRK